MGAAKYDVAISTACGGLDFIVVETTTTAQACVELLRTKQLGVATFLILVSPEWMPNSLITIHESCFQPVSL